MPPVIYTVTLDNYTDTCIPPSCTQVILKNINLWPVHTWFKKQEQLREQIGAFTLSMEVPLVIK